MRVVFVDNHLLVVEKPAGMPTQSDNTSSLNLHQLAKEWVKREYHKMGNVFLEPIHRLDKPVSGLVLFARTSKALSRLQAMMREHKITKIYTAWVEGVPEKEEATLEHYLVHEEHYARVATKQTKQAKRALLHYRLLRKEKQGAVLEITLHTGRYHQIRAQLAAIGHPILGDTKYGSTKPSPIPGGIGLQHTHMRFTHPVTHQSISLDLYAP